MEFSTFITTALALLFLSAAGYAYYHHLYPAKVSSKSRTTAQTWIAPLDLIIMGIIFSFYGLSAIASSSAPPSPLDLSKITVSSIAVTAFSSLIILFPVGCRWATLGKEHPFYQACSLQPFKPKTVLLYYVIGIGLTIAINFVIQQPAVLETLENLFGPSKLQNSVKALAEHSDPWVLGAISFSAIIIAPLIEELIFRGYFLPVLQKFTNVTFALIWQALCFSLIHANMLGIFSLFALGLVLGIAYLKSKSLWVPIGVHAAFNATTIAFQILERN